MNDASAPCQATLADRRIDRGPCADGRTAASPYVSAWPAGDIVSAPVTRYLSLLDDPPPGFSSGRIGKRELLSGIVVVLAADCESAYALLAGFRERVEGVVVTYGEAHVARLGPLLWHARLPRGSVAADAPLLALAVDALAAASAERNTARSAQLAREQLRSDHEMNVRDYLHLTGSLHRQVELLAASECKLNTILDSVDAFIYLKDRQGRYLFANRALRELWKAGIDDIVGASDERFYDAPTAAMMRINALRVIDGGETVRAEEDAIDPLTGARRTWLSTRLPLRGDDGEIYALCGISTDITARKVAEDEIRRLAFFDPLTLLPNRRLLLDRIEQALAASQRHKHRGALLYIDLDHFKNLNDTLGHDVGDELLCQVGARLRGCVRDEDTVARLGGDEFVVMLTALDADAQSAASQAERVADKILACFAAPFDLACRSHRCTASVGIALFADQQTGIDDLLKRADLSMYQAKASGRNTLRFFNPEMQTEINARVALEADLAEAIERGQLELHYQPQMARGGQLTGAEALLRWHHAQRGLVLPGEFIALAEENGMILTLGRWVLHESCAQLARWAHDAATAHLTIAVNVSVRQFHQRDFVAQVLAALDATGADPRRLKLELTESLLVVNFEDVIAKMSVLKARGVGFSLDDFGTGYSSLAYLKRLPFDQLKIDQGFVRDILTDPNDAAIARMIVALADSLGLDVIAEGVETRQQLDFLEAHGCHAYQGYCFSRPLPLPDFVAFLGRLAATRVR